MSNDNVKNFQFRDDTYPEVVRVANELAKLENRKPHDSIKILIEEAGQAKIDRLKEEKANGPERQ